MLILVIIFWKRYMQQAGATAGVFLPEAAHSIFDYAQGIPRHINRIALASLINGVGKKIKPITAKHVAWVITSMDSN